MIFTASREPPFLLRLTSVSLPSVTSVTVASFDVVAWYNGGLTSAAKPLHHILPEQNGGHLTVFHDDVIKWKHFPRNWPFVRGIHRSPVYSPHKGQWRGALMFSLICVWINGWVNSGGAGDLRRYRTHYDVIVMNGGLSSAAKPLHHILPEQNGGHLAIAVRVMALCCQGIIESLFTRFHDAIWRHRLGLSELNQCWFLVNWATRNNLRYHLNDCSHTTLFYFKSVLKQCAYFPMAMRIFSDLSASLQTWSYSRTFSNRKCVSKPIKTQDCGMRMVVTDYLLLSACVSDTIEKGHGNRI